MNDGPDAVSQRLAVDGKRQQQVCRRAGHVANLVAAAWMVDVLKACASFIIIKTERNKFMHAKCTDLAQAG